MSSTIGQDGITARQGAETGYDNARRNAFIVMCYSFAGVIGLYGAGAYLRFSDLTTGILICAVASLTFSLVAWRAKRESSLAASAWTFISFAILFAAAGAYLNGGVDGYVAPFLIIAPLAAGYFLNRRATIVTGMATILVATGLVALDLNGMVIESPYTNDIIVIRSGFVMVAAIGLSMICVLSFTRNIQNNTRRVEHQRALLTAFAHSAPIAMAMFDREMRYMEVSDRWLTDYDQSREDLIGKSHYDVCPEIPQVWREVHERCLKGATERADGDRFEREDGCVYWGYWEVRPWHDEAGEIGGIVLITRDVTEQIHRQQELERKTAEAERASALKSSFLANISHEIRTPLNGVLGLSQSLEDDDMPASQRERVRTIRETGELMLTILNDVLDLSKIEADKMELTLQPADPDALVRHVTRLFEPAARQKGLTLTMAIEESVPPHVLIDTTRVKQCLSNIVSNAVKFTEAGEIAITARHEDDKGRPTLVLHVSDTGIGIPEDQQERLFGDFMQADHTIAKRFGGTGLGLSLTRRLARMMEGDVSIIETSSQGSTFELRLGAEPCTDGSARVPVSLDHSQLKWLEGASVLLADDIATNRMVAEMFLTAHGATVLHAENGQEVLEHLETTDVDIVLLDLQMPVLNGAQTIARIRANTGRWGSLPVIALTGEAGPGARARFLSMGLTDYIEKPIHKTAFLNTITTALHDAARLKSLEDGPLQALQHG